MARLISSDIEIVGLRPGEVESEDLISSAEVPYTKEINDNYLVITPNNMPAEKLRLAEPLSSSNAPEMDESEMQNLLNTVDSSNTSSYIEEKNY